MCTNFPQQTRTQPTRNVRDAKTLYADFEVGKSGKNSAKDQGEINKLKGMVQEAAKKEGLDANDYMVNVLQMYSYDYIERNLHELSYSCTFFALFKC